jgi:hypothetical protein
MAAGMAALNWGLGGDVSWIGLVVGAASCAVLGGWAALLATSFWVIARQTWREARRETPPLPRDPSSPRRRA